MPAAPTDAPAPQAPAAPSLDEAMNQHLAVTQPTAPAQQPKPEAPQAPKPEPSQTRKTALDRLKGVETPKEDDAPAPKAEETPAPAEAEPADPKGLSPEAQRSWTELKRDRKELMRVKPEFERLKAEVEQLRTQASTPKVPEEVTQELEQHRQFRAAYDWENQPEFQKEVTAPMQKHWGDVAEVVEFLGVNPEAVEKAIREPNRLRRNELIKQALTTSEKEVDAQAVSDVCTAANAIHQVHAKGQEMKTQALELQNVLKGQQEKESAQQKAAREAAWGKASGEISGLMEAKFAPILKDNTEATKELREARIAEDVMDQAMQAQSAALLPYVTDRLNAALARVAELERAAKARNGARPTLDGGAQPQNGAQKLEISLEEATAAHFGARG